MNVNSHVDCGGLALLILGAAESAGLASPGSELVGSVDMAANEARILIQKECLPSIRVCLWETRRGWVV